MADWYPPERPQSHRAASSARRTLARLAAPLTAVVVVVIVIVLLVWINGGSGGSGSGSGSNAAVAPATHQPLPSPDGSPTSSQPASPTPHRTHPHHTPTPHPHPPARDPAQQPVAARQRHGRRARVGAEQLADRWAGPPRRCRGREPRLDGVAGREPARPGGRDDGATTRRTASPRPSTWPTTSARSSASSRSPRAACTPPAWCSSSPGSGPAERAAERHRRVTHYRVRPSGRASSRGAEGPAR